MSDHDEQACPCEGVEHPRVITNPPGRETINYRVGDYKTFRHALLLSRAGETELKNWRPGASGDLAVQMVEWWAYLADVLTFYNERAMTEAFLRTATLPESVKRLIQILGYRPRPGIGASGVVAALVSGKKPITLPQGLQIQSKPGPGQEPQVFELDAETVAGVPDSVDADPPPDTKLIKLNSANLPTVLLKGDLTGSVKAGDELLLMKKGWVGTDTNFALVTVKTSKTEQDTRGADNTRVTFTQTVSLPAGALASDYRLMRSAQSSKPYQSPAQHIISEFDYELSGCCHAHFESLKRDIKVGDPVLLENPLQSPSKILISVAGYYELLWYANAPSNNPPSSPPSSTNVPAIAVPHTVIDFKPTITGTVASNWNTKRAAMLLRFAFQDVGELIATPSATFSGASATLAAVSPPVFPAYINKSLLLEDGDGDGVTGLGSVGTDPSTFQLSNLTPTLTPLKPPFKVLFNLLSVSRGKTVLNEVLGSGDATVAGQEFVLKKSPLTYLLSASSSGSYQSTLRVWVDGVEWSEVASFYAQPKDARVFVTREDVEDKTHVMFGDGINGARLPSGVNNVVAQYRHGSGQESPDVGKLTVILQPQPDLKGIRNPVGVGGGADPDPPDQIRRYAPQSVLTFGRAVSGDDYETVAAQAPGVTRARAYWAFNPEEQRTMVTVYVGDDASAVNAAKVALTGAADPNRPVVVKPATLVPARLVLSLRLHPDYLPDDVIADATTALLDEETGLFGLNLLRVGQAVYRSKIYEACLSVEGALAVHGLKFYADKGSGFNWVPGFRFDPGEGGFFQLASENLNISPEVSSNVV